MAKPPLATLPAESTPPKRRMTLVPLAPMPDVEAIGRAMNDDGGRIQLQQAALPINLAAELFTLFAQHSANAANALSEQDVAATVMRLGRAAPGYALNSQELSAPYSVDPVAVATGMQSHGQYKEAEQVLRQALIYDTAKHGLDHERVHSLQLALAALLQASDQGAEAKRLLVTTVERQREKLGSRAKATLATLEQLGLLLVASNELVYAEPLLCEVVLVRRHLGGDDHPDTLRAVVSLATLLLAQGKPSEAEPLLRRALRLTEDALGETSLEVSATRNLLAETLMALGNVADAEALLVYGLTTVERAVGRAHVAWLEQVALLGEFLLTARRPSESRSLLTDAVALAQRMLPAGGSLLARLRGLFGRCLRAIGALAQSEDHLVAAYQALRETLGLAHATTQKLLSEVIALYVAMGKPSLAAPYRATHAKCS